MNILIELKRYGNSKCIITMFMVILFPLIHNVILTFFVKSMIIFFNDKNRKRWRTSKQFFLQVALQFCFLPIFFSNLYIIQYLLFHIHLIIQYFSIYQMRQQKKLKK